MTKISHPKDSHRHEPTGQERLPAAKRVAYHLRTPLVYDRVSIKRAAAAHGARSWGILELIEQMRAEVQEVLAGDAAALTRILGILDKRHAALSALYDDISNGVFEWDTEDGRAAFATASGTADETLAEFLPVEAQLRGLGGRYADMAADNEVHLEIVGIEAARTLLTGWDNLGPFERPGFKGVPEEVLARIPEAHLPGLGAAYLEMCAPNRAEEKNSGSPSHTGSNGTASTSAAPARGPRRKRRSSTPRETPTVGKSPN